MPVITSNFTGTESPLSEGGLWETDFAGGGLGPMSKNNRAQATNANEHTSARGTTPAIDANQYSQANMYWAFDRGGIGVMVRMQAGVNSSAYVGFATRDGAVWNSGFSIREYDSGGSDSVIIESTAVTPTSGSLVRLEIDGDALTLYENGVVRVGPNTDATLSAGQPGIGIRRNTGSAASDLELGTYEGGDLAGVPANLLGTRDEFAITQRQG